MQGKIFAILWQENLLNNPYTTQKFQLFECPFITHTIFQDVSFLFFWYLNLMLSSILLGL